MIHEDQLAHDLEQMRRKYYDSLATLEGKEKEWARTENILRQCISRLTLAVDGEDKDLSREMDRLRNAIRKNVGNSELEKHIDALSQHLLRLDEERSSRNKALQPVEILQFLVGKLNFPRGVGHRARSLGRQLDKLDEKDDLTPHLDEFLGLLAASFAWLEGQQHEEENGEKANDSSPGLLGRLFRRDEPAPASPPATAPPSGVQPSATRQAADHALPLARNLLKKIITALAAPPGLLDRAEKASREDELQHVVDELARLFRTNSSQPANTSLTPQEVLLQLLERLPVPLELCGEVESIKTALGTAESEDELVEVLTRIANLVAILRNRTQGERAEVERFLKQLTGNLQDLEHTLQMAVSSHRDSVTAGHKMDADVQVEMKGIEDSVQWAQNLEHLKELVQKRVDTIRRRMEVFRRTEDERIEQAEEQAEEQVARLSARMRVLETETEQLRGRLEKERNLAMTDPLTEIPNRQAYNDRITQEFARWQRYQSPLVLGMWDVDHFKRINDTYGHQAGDKVLKVLAALLTQKIRATDFVARVGGEEFVILMPETDLQQARVVAEKIRHAVETCEFHHSGSRVPITISGGLAVFRNGDESHEQVYARADQALYRAKAAGRNRCLTEEDP